MKQLQRPQIELFDVLISVLSLASLIAAVLLAVHYANDDNPASVLFLLRHDTYDKALPFLLGTVAIGGFALVYNRVQVGKGSLKEARRAAGARLRLRIQRLQKVFDTVLLCFQDVRLQRRRLRELFVPGQEKDVWRIRRSIYEEVLTILDEAQLAAERVMKTFDLERDALAGELKISVEEQQLLSKLHDDLRSQIGGIQGVLRNVLETTDWKGVTAGTSGSEDLVTVPSELVTFASPGGSGNLGFRKIGEHYDAFAKNISKRIRELEEEAISFGSSD